MKRFRFPIIALASMTLLGLELIWTRIFSAEFFYTYAFLVLSLAVMGLGLGALTLRFFPVLGRRKYLSLILTLSAGAALAGPPLVFNIGLSFEKLFEGWAMIGKLASAIGLLSAAYYFAGIGFSALFRRNHSDMPRLYMADLLGAGLGVVAAVVLMNVVGTPRATFLAAVPMLLAAALAARSWRRVLPALCLIAPFLMLSHAVDWLEAPRQERGEVLSKHWDASAKIKILGYGSANRGVNIDNAANSPVFAFDGHWDPSNKHQFNFMIDVSNLLKRFEQPTFLSLGAGGGGDVLQALQYGAQEIHAVEVIPYINKLMLDGDLAEFSGHIYQDPRVHVVTEDARAYVRRHKNKFDVIYSLSSNTFAALASGSFALAENYLFTAEAFEDYWEALSDDGFLSMEHQFYMSRIVGSMLEALDHLGVPDPRAHFAVYDLPTLRRKLLLLSKKPLTEELIRTAYGELPEDNSGPIRLLYPAPAGREEGVYNRLVRDGWQKIAPDVPINVAPSMDDRPFIGEMGLWKNFKWEKPDMRVGMSVYGYPYSQLIVMIILGVAFFLILPMTLWPYLGRGPYLPLTSWWYFFLIGAAYMAVEVVLIQKYTLFVGPSAYSVAAILLTLLVCSGLGSRCSARVPAPLAFLLLIGWLVFEAFWLGRVTAALENLTMLPRIGVAALLVAPLGFLMGMPFPKAALRVGRLIDWGFAVNGVASVFGGAAIILVAMTFGIRCALLTGAGLYLLAGLLMMRRTGWRAIEPAT